MALDATDTAVPAPALDLADATVHDPVTVAAHAPGQSRVTADAPGQGRIRTIAEDAGAAALEDQTVQTTEKEEGEADNSNQIDREAGRLTVEQLLLGTYPFFLFV